MFYFVSEKNKEEYFWKCSVNYKVNFVLFFVHIAFHSMNWFLQITRLFYLWIFDHFCQYFVCIFRYSIYGKCVCALDGCVCQIFHKWWLLENEMSIYEKWFQVWLYWILISNIFGNNITATNQRLYIFVGVSPNIANIYIYDEEKPIPTSERKT